MDPLTVPAIFARHVGAILLVGAALCPSVAAADSDDAAADYMPAIRQELARLDVAANCDESTGTCVFSRKIGVDGRAFEFGIRYCRTTETVYVYIDRFLELPSPDGPSVELARRLLELNRRMVTAKLEWDRPTNSIRLSVVINTDSNFDRRAFRSQLKGLIANAERLWPELDSLARPVAAQ
jgi:hypothetical protein